MTDPARLHAPPHTAALADARLRTRQALSALQALDPRDLRRDHFTALSCCASALSDVAFELARVEQSIARGRT